MKENIKIVFASNNQHKIKEIQSLLPKHFIVLSLSDIQCEEQIPETGTTLEENALQKANYIYKKYGYNVFSDDTGLEVQALNNQPGVYSARYAGEEKNAQKNIKLLLDNLNGISNRKAQFRTVIALIFNGKQYLFEGIVTGEITHQLHGENGFGYDPIFRAEHHKKTFAQMTLDEKNTISHRARAFQKLVQFLTNKV